MNRLQGKHILITGASQGLGRELALAFAREGASALALAARNNDALDEVRARVRELAPEESALRHPKTRRRQYRRYRLCGQVIVPWLRC